MDVNHSSPQTLNLLFSFLSQLENTTIWICTPDYKKQLFLSDSFNKIWGFEKEKMFDNMSIWMDTLYKNDIPTIKKALIRRSTEKQNCSLVSFRIRRPDNEIRFLKSSTYNIKDHSEKTVAIIGVDENLSSEQWEKTKKIASATTPILKDLSSIIAKELKLIIPTTNVTPSTEVKSLPKVINVNNKSIPLTDRESQCLIYLIQGKSAKETAYYLKISTRTVETYLDNIRYKANCRTKIALVGLLQQQQLFCY